MKASEANKKHDAILKSDASKIYTAIEKHIKAKKQDKYIFWYEELTSEIKKELTANGFTVSKSADFRNGAYAKISWKPIDKNNIE